MGGVVSTIRWTPYGPVPGHTSRRRADSWSGHHNNYQQQGSSGLGQHASDSPPHYSYDNEDDDDFLHHLPPQFQQPSGAGAGASSNNTNNDNSTSSGILMGANAPPLYDACLIGRWEDVLEICNQDNNNGTNEDGGTAGGSNTTEVTMGCSSSGDEEGEHHDTNDLTVTWGNTDLQEEGEDDDNGVIQEEPTPTHPNHPCIQTRYVDRRRNTPLHLACRRQPPPSVVKALLNHSPCEAASRRTADGLTPLHFAAYCGAEVEVVSMLVDRMRSDAAVGRAMRLSHLTSEEGESSNDSSGGRGGGTGSNVRPKTMVEDNIPPTRLLDRRQRTPLHCACAGFRTSTRPAIVRKLLSVDPASATLMDEKGRTPFSLLFDDYAEEVMESLEEDVTPDMVRERIKEGGELYECWKMLKVLLQAAYKGSVSEEEVKEELGDDNLHQLQTSVLSGIGEEYEHERGGGLEEKKDSSTTPPQDRPVHHEPQTREVNVLDYYDQQNFSIVHAAAGVWECPAPMAKLVLKCMCGPRQKQVVVKSSSNVGKSCEEDNNYHLALEGDDSEWNLNIASTETEETDVTSNSHEGDIIRQPDEDSIRLPLHIAVCARPQEERGGHSARIKYWLSSSEASSMSRGLASARGKRSQSQSFSSGTSTTSSESTRPGRSPIIEGQVYNPRFGRSHSRDGVAAFSDYQQRQGRVDGSRHGPSSSKSLGSSMHSVSSMGHLSREPFLEHTMVQDVLALYPSAASVVDDRTGKLPIVLAIENGKSWETAVGPLLEAYSKPFGGGGDGGVALPDDGEESQQHRKALQAALLSALSGPEAFVREEAKRTAGRLAKWGGIWGMPEGLDGIISEWLDTMINQRGVDGTATGGDWVRTQASLLMCVAETVSHSRPGSVSDRVARLCLDTGREFLFSKDSNVREAAARVLGAALDSVGDADDAATVMREVVLNIFNLNEEGSVCSASTVGRGRREDVIMKHGKLLGCTSIMSIKWGSNLMAIKEIRDAIISLLRRRVKDKNTVVRSTAYRAIGPVLGKSPSPDDPNVAVTTTTMALKEMRSDILKGTRATEQVEVQLALARGLISASKMHPGLFLCKSGMPIMDAALMLAMSSSSARPNVQKAFQVFLWVALEMGKGSKDMINDGIRDDGSQVGTMSIGLEKYISLAEGENGRIMMNFVTRTLAKIEDVDDQF